MSIRTLAPLALLALLVGEFHADGRAQQPSETSPASVSSTTPDLTPGPDGKLSADQMHRLFQVMADKDLQNQKQARDYTYIARQVENKLDGKGETKSTEVKTYEVLEIDGEPVQRLIAKNDKPLDAKEAAKEGREDSKDHR